MINTQNTLICLMGPTASGKTHYAIQLAQWFPFEIISVDSALVYRGMDIGTAKPDAAMLAELPHHLINIRDPSEAYSAAQFRKDALKIIKEIHARKKTPLLVGGTMLYFRALQKGLALMPSADAAVRAQLSEEANKKGWTVLHRRLADIDPLAASRIHPNDPQRIQRALEVYLLSGKNLTTWQQEQQEEPFDYDIYNVIVAPEQRHILHTRIAERFKQMLAAGFIEEVKALYARPDLNLDTPAIRSVGYRQVWEYLDGRLTYEEMQEKAIIATRQLAKRQLTWLRSWPNAIWFNSEADNCLMQMVNYLLSEDIDLL
jgi:tRNA dimethylallyltransferase